MIPRSLFWVMAQNAFGQLNCTSFEAPISQEKAKLSFFCTWINILGGIKSILSFQLILLRHSQACLILVLTNQIPRVLKLEQLKWIFRYLVKFLHHVIHPEEVRINTVFQVDIVTLRHFKSYVKDVKYDAGFMFICVPP